MAQTISLSFPVSLHLPRLGSVWRVLADWRRRSAEKAELARFDTRDLADCGMTPADRAAIMATPFWREAGPLR